MSDGGGVKRRYAVVRAPTDGVVSFIAASSGATVSAGEEIMGIEVMKMIYPVKAPVGGTVEFTVKVGEMVTVEQTVAKVFV